MFKLVHLYTTSVIVTLQSVLLTQPQKVLFTDITIEAYS